MELITVLVILGLLATAGLTYVVVRRRDDHTLDPSPKGGTTVLERPETPSSTVEVEEAPGRVAPAPTREPEVAEPPLVEVPVEVPVEAPPTEVAPLARPSFRERLAKARGTISGYLGSVLSRAGIDADTWDEPRGGFDQG